MAHAGAATTAYHVQVNSQELHVIRKITALRDQCARIDDALLHLSRGEIVTVAGTDLQELIRRVQIALQQA